jgi:hypothetical protein
LHYYIHLSIDQPNGLSPYNLYSVINQTPASQLDQCLFQRILQINPDLQLPHHDPNVYQTKLWMNKKVSCQTPAQHLETIGILKQLFSRFLEAGQSHTITSLLKYNIQPILLHILNNLQRDISVDELAGIACFSKDHFYHIEQTGFKSASYFSRIFKKSTSYPPEKYRKPRG